MLVRVIEMSERSSWAPRAGELVIYLRGGNLAEIGRVKEVMSDTKVRVNYHSGETAALTDVSQLLQLANAYCITTTTLGKGE